jgi:ferredoxin
MIYKIEVNRVGCISCKVCYCIDPVHFEADWENKSAVVNGNGYLISIGSFEDDLLDDAKTAMRSCPVSAINVNETSGFDKKNRTTVLLRNTNV